MRSLFIPLIAAVAMLFVNPVQAGDAVAECKAFFEKFQQCIDGLKGDDQEDAHIP